MCFMQCLYTADQPSLQRRFSRCWRHHTFNQVIDYCVYNYRAYQTECYHSGPTQISVSKSIFTPWETQCKDKTKLKMKKRLTWLCLCSFHFPVFSSTDQRKIRLQQPEKVGDCHWTNNLHQLMIHHLPALWC